MMKKIILYTSVAAAIYYAFKLFGNRVGNGFARGDGGWQSSGLKEGGAGIGNGFVSREDIRTGDAAEGGRVGNG